MEEVYFAAGVVAFALAACSFVACLVIFVRADVPNAIRFLRHQPLKQGRHGKVVIPKATPKKEAAQKGRFHAAKEDGAAVLPLGDSTTTVIHTTDELSERPTGLLQMENSERGTELLEGEAPRYPTLDSQNEVERSERPTSLLEPEPAERATDVLAIEPTERPTSLLEPEPAERATDVLAKQPVLQGESTGASGVAQHEETTFRFILKHNEIVVHTHETID